MRYLIIGKEVLQWCTDYKMRSTPSHSLHSCGSGGFYLGYSAGKLWAHLQRISEVGQKWSLRIPTRLSKKAKANLHHKHSIANICVRAQHSSHGAAHWTLQRFLEYRWRNCQQASERSVEHGIWPSTTWPHKILHAKLLWTFFSWH